MLHRRKKAALTGLAVLLAAAVAATGCSLFEEVPSDLPESESESESETETEVQTESETETEVQTNVVYVSEDGTIRILLPDMSWTVTQDIDEMRVFTSGSDAMINIVHADDAEAMENVSVMESEEELEESLDAQYPEEDAFEILSFEKRSSSTIQVYEYVVNYTYSTSMWAYSVTYGILSAQGDAAYVVSGTVTEDDRDLLDAVQTSVESFSVLDMDSIFSVLPGIVRNNDSEKDKEEPEGSEELAALTAYAQAVTLYASSEVNIREQPSTEAEIIGALSQGESVSVTGETTSWFLVRTGSGSGYVNKAFLTYTQPETSVTAASENESGQESLYGASYTYYTTSPVNLRTEPSTDSTIAGGLSSGTAITVIGETNDWYVVSVGGSTCYVAKAYVSAAQPAGAADTSGDNAADTGTASNTDGTTDSGTSSSGGTYDSSSTGMLSGTVTSISGTTVTLEGGDGNTYYIDYQNAGSLSVGSSVTAAVDYAQTTDSGALYATSVY